MKRIVIVGGGFAGLSAARRLARHSHQFEVVLIDPRAEQNFLPLLPDLIGCNLESRTLCYPLNLAAKRWNFQHRQESVVAVHTVEQRIETGDGGVEYDYLLLAAGTQTNLRGRADLKQDALMLHSVADAVKIRAALQANQYHALVVAGGGYTGVETATQLWRYMRKATNPTPVYLIEHGLAVCGALPVPFQGYIAKNLQALNIQVRTGTEIAAVKEGDVSLNSGESFSRAMLVWTAGVCAPDFVGSLAGQKSKNGCLPVDANLRVQDNIFAAGDLADFQWQGKSLRMGIQFALAQGECAAGNILRLEQGEPLQTYRPTDLGYVVPMANGRACGRVLGANLYGRTPLFLHYAMSLLRSSGWDNRIGVVKQVLQSHWLS